MKIMSERETRAARKVWLVGNGYDTSIEASRVNRDLVERYDLANTFTCVYIGNIGLAQGLGSLLSLAAGTKHRNVQFLVFGKGAAKEDLMQMAEEMGLDQVRFCGVLPHEDVYTVLKYAGVSFISLKNANMKDSIPTKLYEALGIGCPVFLVAEGDACAVLEETGLGRHVSPDHPERLVREFDEMLDDYERILEQRESAKTAIHSRYTRQQIANEFVVQVKMLLDNTYEI